MIEVKRLAKRYGETVALEDVSFDVSRGEVLGFLGPNGAGKTTTMRIITGYLKPDRGYAKVAGYDILKEPQEVKKRIGYLPEDNPLYNDLTPVEYLKFVGEVRGINGRRLRDSMDRVIHIAGIEEVLFRPIGELSRGYKQRVGIAQALLHDPEILILDEPTSGLDPTQIVEIRQLIKELGKEKTIILSTHILPEVSVTSTRVLIINKGSIVASGTADELAQKSTDRMVLRVEILGNPDEIERTFEETPWVESWTRSGESDGAFTYTVKGPKNEDIRGKVFYLAKEKGWTLLEMWRERASLEEVFLKLTTEEA